MSRWPGGPRPCAGRSQTNPNTGGNSRIRQKHGREGIFGDLLKRKREDHIRILLVNVNSIGFISDQRSLESLKMEKLKRLIIKESVDYAALTETNKNWSAVPQEHSIWNGTQGWRQHRRAQVSWNKTIRSTEERLIGGTASLAFDDLVFRISQQSNDIRNLGRWSIVTIKGKNNLTTSVITCYCPVKNASSPGSVYSQHLTYLAQHREEIPAHIQCPRQLFGYDLANTITNLQQSGQQVLVMGDFNSDYTKLKEWMMDKGLVDLIAAKHGPCPRTCKKSANQPIDCIFGSPQLTATESGFLSFSALVSDHRALWLDIPKALLLGYNPPQLNHPQARRLILNDPRVKLRFIDYMKEHLLPGDTADLSSLHRTTCHPLTDAQAAEFERLDAISSSVMDDAEAQCRKLRMGQTPWSPTYKKAMMTFEYWCKRENHVTGVELNARDLIWMQKKLLIPYDPELSLEDIRQKKYECYLSRRKCTKMAEQLSLEYRYRLALAREEDGKGKAATYIRQRNQVEQQRRTFRNIRQIEQRVKGGATTFIITRDQAGNPIEITDRKPMEEAMLKANSKKYHQIEDTPSSQFLQMLYTQLFGKYGEGPATQEVLNGTFIPPDDATEDMKDFLKACEYKGDQPTRMTVLGRYLKMQKTWRIRKEKTVSHNQHMGQYKCIMEDAELSWFFFRRAEIPLLSGYSCKRHRTCIDLMILKKAGNFELSKLRTLGLLDTEFNNNNKTLGHEATHRALDLECIAPEQFSRPGRSAIDQTIAKRCTFDHHRSRRLTYSICSSDLAGCYDRIVHTAAALALLRLGLDHAKVLSMFDSIQRMVHKVRTAFGDSEESYGGDDLGDWQNYPQGILQGNASGPAIWSILSSVVFEILQARGYSNHFCSAISQQLFLLVGFSYVDDCDLFQSGTDKNEVLESMQELLNNWGGLMKVTGGALRSDKSWWYLVEFVWHRGKWIPVDAGENLRLYADDVSGQRVELTYLPCSEASEMLGIWMAPDGNNKQLVSALKEISVDWSSKFQTSSTSSHVAWTALHSTISARLKYPLPASTLSQDECTSIMHPTFKVALPKSGIAANVSTDCRHGPLKSGGYGAISLFHYQGTSRTAALVEHCLRKTPTGKLINVCIEDLVLEIGYFQTLWLMPFPTYQKWTSDHSWVYAICEYNFTNNIKLHLDHASLSPKRTHDKPIMELAATHFDTAGDLSAINRVRMFHGVVSLADITTADGHKLNDEFLCPEEFDGRRNDFLWPDKNHISSKDVTTWRKAMEFIFHGPDLSLIQPLGTCILEEEKDWLSHWDWFTSETRDFAFRQVGENNWRRHLRKPGTQRTFYSDCLDLTERPSQPLLRASMGFTNNHWVLLNTSNRSSYILRDLHLPAEHIGCIPFIRPTEDWFLHHLSASEDTEALWQCLKNGTALVVSDGSFYPHDEVGACAWKIFTPCLTQWIQAGGLVPGPPSQQSAYRSEVAGQTGIALFLHAICLPQTIRPTITTSCDGISALHRAQIKSEHIRQSFKHVDLLSITAIAWEAGQFSVKTKHVRGHQDNLHRPLTNLEQVNCEMDNMAKQIALLHISGTRPYPFTPSKKGLGTITIKGQIVCSHVQSTLYTSILHNNFVKKIADKFGADALTFDALTNWKAFGRARKSARFSIQKFISKWISGDIPSGTVMKKRGHRLQDHCPLCHAPAENLLHILTCPNESARIFRLQQLTELSVWLQAEDTHHDIADLFISGLTSWFSDPQGFEPFHHAGTYKILQAINSQLEFSWFAVLCGYISHHITTVQQSYFTSIGSRKTGQCWTKKLILKLWDILHNIWKFRNDALHQEATLSQLSGMDQLKQAIIQEHTTGLDTLPPVYRSYFSRPLETLLAKPVTHLKQWFLVIRSGRECYGHHIFLDEFYTNPVLRTWVGLSAIDTG